ncbi:hypothetical protein [Occallatibacter riparius]|uniref:Uncharacterized protein n=1 Tax=Occallatibacter riparius TaxID=1002689 RepID=A0A9J7BQV2_9BACT|nr:hypothetical protein [Occallatibacter riparius]UWZ83469.1 hypothetical protein MOP44_23245 [Occallatibacter riparius]
MKLLRLLSLPLVLSALAAVPAFANPTVTSPYANSTVSSPFTLTANSSSCSNQSVTTMGYSLDSSSSTVFQSGTYLQKSVSAATGGHTIHVKAWGKSGAVCVTDVPVKVSGTTSGNPGVSSPTSGSTVTSPFKLYASSSSCSGQAVASVGYSIDSSTYTYIVGGTVLSTSVSTGTGGHTIHVKSWGKSGASCVNNVGVTVSGTSSTVPSNATNVSNVQVTGTWASVHDAGTSGWSSGTSSLTSSPSRSGNARHYNTSYNNYGGQRYSTHISDNTAAHNFVYDVWVYIKDTSTGVKVLEMDLNQVIANGWTVIMGVQCDGWTGTWDFTTNKGSATSPNDTWVHSSAKCNPQSWGVNAWHHIQYSVYRDDSGFVTYQWMSVDGAKQTLNAKTFAGFALGWGKTVLTNFQVDGGTSYAYGSNIFVDNMNVSYW